MHRAFRLLLLASVLASGCARLSPPIMSPRLSGSCRAGAIRWFAPQTGVYRSRLDSWCRGVGPPVILQPRSSSLRSQPVGLEAVTFVNWNVHVGNGDIKAFVKDLRAGAFSDGREVQHFVLLLQEVVRTDDVPPYGPGASGAARIAAREASPDDIVRISHDLDLSLVYVPSMRNGDSPAVPAADRGSAILSTLPLSDPIAIELPGERQRRVAIVATLGLPLAEPGIAPVSVGVVHLDALGAFKRLWLFGTTSMRELQVRSMQDLLPRGTLILGADLNTWHGKDEPAARLMDRLFNQTAVARERHGLGLRTLDYLFFRAAEGRTARSREVAQTYGSDHRPLIGWIDGPFSRSHRRDRS